MNLLSRNRPTAFVVGAAGFLGSHLTDKLLAKGVQVVGIDDLSCGRMENLAEASSNKDLHFINQSAQSSLPIDLPRLDYAFFVINDDSKKSDYLPAFCNFLDICKAVSPRIVLVSTIELYDSHVRNYPQLREAERKLAEFAKENNANARVVRLAPVYGPRMHFKNSDPISRLIQATALNQLQKEIIALDFTSRSLYVDDAVNLLIKAVMHGATAQKIYDGALVNPLKVSEIRQVLLDPLWHEAKGFVPTELPPWPTPNLMKTCKELSWKPATSIVFALKETLHYFSDRENLVPKLDEDQKTFDEPEIKQEKTKEVVEPEKRQLLAKIAIDPLKVKNFSLVIIGLVIICFALLYPIVNLGWRIWKINNYLYNTNQQLEQGRLDGARQQAIFLNREVEKLNQAARAVNFVNKSTPVTPWLNIISKVSEAQSENVLGTISFSQGMKIISGENSATKSALLTEAFEQTTFNFEQAERLLSLTAADLISPNFLSVTPEFMGGWLNSLQKLVDNQLQLSRLGKSTNFLLSQIVADKGQKSYLVLLTNNTILRSGGGQIMALAKVNFTDGRLVGITAKSVKELDEILIGKAEPPAVVKQELGTVNSYFKDLTAEMDFTAVGKLSEWYFTKTGGETVDGVMALDLTAVAELLKVYGPMSLDNPSLILTAGDMVDKITDPGSPANLEAAVLKETLNRLFYLTPSHAPATIVTLGQMLNQKHLLIYLPDPLLLSYLKNQNWAGGLTPTVKEKAGERNEYFGVTETNLNAFPLKEGIIKRSWDLISTIDNNDNLTNQLKVRYNFSKVGDKGQVYQYKLTFYLSPGSQLTKLLWEEENLLNKVSSFADFGRAGYSINLELSPGQKNLTLEYKNTRPVGFEGKSVFKLYLSKQVGQGSEPFHFRLNYPANYQLAPINQQSDYQLDLKTDQRVEINFLLATAG